MARRRMRIRPGRFLLSLGLIAAVLWATSQGFSRAMAWMSRCSPIPETVSVSRKLPALVLRDEARVYSQNSGTVSYFVQDGEKVQTGQKIAEIVVTESAALVQAPLASQTVLDGNRQKKAQLELEIGTLLDDIARGVNAGELTGISSLKADLKLKLADRNQLDQEISALEKGFQPDTSAAGSTSARTGQVLDIRSPGSGIISFYSDGLEETLKPALYRTIAPDTLTAAAPSGIAVPEIRSGNLFYKLVDSSVWYVLVTIQPTDRQLLSQGQGIDLKIGEESFQATLKEVLEQNGQPILMLETRGALTDFHKIRHIEAELTIDRYPGIAVPPSSVLENGSQTSVITVDGANNRKSVPVKIISRLPDRIVLAEGSFFDGQGTALKQFETITRNDYILRNPKPGDLPGSQNQE